VRPDGHSQAIGIPANLGIAYRTTSWRRGDSRRASPWAAQLYDDAIARGHDHPHAVRILARAWLYVIWHCWQDGVAYDPARHKALQRFLTEQKSKAA
jgi:transposase